MKRITSWKIVVMVTVAVLASCKKEPLPDLPEGNSPIYTLNGNVNSDSVDLSVGLDGTKLNYGLSEENGLITHFGEIDAPNKNEKFRIEFIQQERPETANETRVFNDFTVPYLVHEQVSATLDFGGVGNQTSYVSISKSDSIPFLTTNAIELKEYGLIPIRVRFSDHNTPERVYRFTINYGYAPQNLNPSFTSESGNKMLYLTADGEAMAHKWYLNDVLVNETNMCTWTLEDGIHCIVHSVEDEYGNIAEETEIMRFKGGKEFWRMDVKYEDKALTPQRFGNVIVSMYKNGEWYTSKEAVSNIHDSFFSVDSIRSVSEETLPNDPVLLAYKFKLGAVLYNTSQTDSLVLDNVEGTFAAGLK